MFTKLFGSWFGGNRELTLNDLFKLTWNGYWSKTRFKRSKWATEAKRIYLRNIKAEFGKVSLSEITSKKVRDWHQSFEETPYAGNRNLEVLSRMFRFAEEEELRAINSNPCVLVKAFREKSRKRFATPEEIKVLGRILIRESAAHPQAVGFIYTLMFSGSRPSAIERAEWSQLVRIEHEGQRYGVLTFEGKSTHQTGQDEVVIIPTRVLEIIDSLPKLSSRIFNCKMPVKLWNKIRIEAGCPDLRMRDFRRTFSTIGRAAGVTMDDLAGLMNHKSTQTTMSYALLQNESRVTASAAISARFDYLLSAELVTETTV